MDPKQLIRKKRDGGKLDKQEIEYFVRGCVEGYIPDYQISALLMSVFFNSLDKEETFNLTNCMAKSGQTVDTSEIKGFKADKHSTGGVGDTVTLVLGPLVAACGIKMGKLSGRALGHTGGTIDKLESIPGFRTDLSVEEFLRILADSNLVIAEHTRNFVPADQKLYELRDMTATVESPPLIVSSIMSKKLATNPDGIVLDVKVGSGAFLTTAEDARELAKKCVKIGREAGCKISALITNMNKPLGRMVGNALEIKEAVSVLKGRQNGDLKRVCFNLAGELLIQADKASSLDESFKILNGKINSGEALRQFKTMIDNQNGDPRIVDNFELLPTSNEIYSFTAEDSGYLTSLDALKIGEVSGLLGTSRTKKNEKIDHSAGVEIKREIGDELSSGDEILRLYFNDERRLNAARNKLADAVKLSTRPPRELSPLIVDRIRHSSD